MFCYNCARAGHYGDECNSPRPMNQRRGDDSAFCNANLSRDCKISSKTSGRNRRTPSIRSNRGGASSNRGSSPPPSHRSYYNLSDEDISATERDYHTPSTSSLGKRARSPDSRYEPRKSRGLYNDKGPHKDRDEERDSGRDRHTNKRKKKDEERLTGSSFASFLPSLNSSNTATSNPHTISNSSRVPPPPPTTSGYISLSSPPRGVPKSERREFMDPFPRRNDRSPSFSGRKRGKFSQKIADLQSKGKQTWKFMNPKRRNN